MPSDFPPYTPEQLDRVVRRNTSRSLEKLHVLIADEPMRTPHGLRQGYKQSAWAELTPTERIDHARLILKRDIFDALVARRGVILSDGTRL